MKLQGNQSIFFISVFISFYLFPILFYLTNPFGIIFIRTNLLRINFVFVGRQLRVDFTLSILLTIILTILKLLQFSSINLITSRQRYHIWRRCRVRVDLMRWGEMLCCFFFVVVVCHPTCLVVKIWVR